jgi:hypothetical protein
VSLRSVLTFSIGHTHVKVVSQGHDELANMSLLKLGLLGCSPLQPTITVSLHCLKLYHQIRCWKPSFSIQAMVKVLCALHNVICTLLCFVIIVFHTTVADIISNISRSVCHCFWHISLHFTWRQSLWWWGSSMEHCGLAHVACVPTL